jgi:tRNA pseudouridine32 synthase / 23S rRNA pseudouridine746 synthase
MNDRRSTVALPADVRAWPTLLDFFAEKFPHISRDVWQRRFDGDAIRYADNGEHEVAHAHDVPRAHAKLTYQRHVENEVAIPFEEHILFEDEHMLVADKPHFLPVAPSGDYVNETLLARLQKRTGNAALSPAHRIDRETAGLVLFTKSVAARGAFQALFRERRIEKTYEAIAPLNESLTLPLLPFVYRSRLMRSENFMQAMTVDGDPNAETLIDVVETHVQRDGVFARLKLAPRTGVRHQLRAQLAALGMPIVGDRIYPNLLQHPPTDFSNPLQLLAKTLSFEHPITWARVVVTSGLSLKAIGDDTFDVHPIETGENSIKSE